MIKPRILFVVPFPPPVHGSAMMCQYIKESHLINDAFRCDYVNLSTSRRMDEIGKRSTKKIFRFIGSYFAVLGKLFAYHYDACYLAITCHGMGFLKDAPFVLLCKLFGRKVIIHQHNKGMAKDVDRWPYCWLLPLVYKNTTVILLSWKLYPDVEKVVQRKQVMICPNGIPDIENAPQKKTHAIPHLLFLSNLIESKGVIDLLDACKILKGKGYRFVCNFVGGETKDINAERFNAEVKKRGLNQTACYLGSKYGEPVSRILTKSCNQEEVKCVNYLGKRYGKDKERIFAASDICIFPTYYENECFPLVLLEAMQHGVPVITTDEGGITDVVLDGVNGLICNKRDSEDLANKISFLLDNLQVASDMGQKGKFFYKERFTLRACLVSIAGVLDKVAIPILKRRPS